MSHLSYQLFFDSLVRRLRRTQSVAAAWNDRGQRLAARAIGRPIGRRVDADLISEAAALANLRTGAPRRRWEAAASLGRSGQRSTEALQALVAALADPEPFVRWQAAEALAKQDAMPVFSTLIAALADRDPLRRAGVAQALGRMGGEASLVALRKAAADSDPRVREAVAQAISGCGDPTSGAALLPLLADPNPDVRRAAATSVGCSNDADTAAALAAALDREDQLLTRRAIAAALVHAAHPNAQPALLRALADPDPQVRGYVAQALGQIGDETAHAALERLTSDRARLLHGVVGDAVRDALTMLERRGRRGALAASTPEAP